MHLRDFSLESWHNVWHSKLMHAQADFAEKPYLQFQDFPSPLIGMDFQILTTVEPVAERNVDWQNLKYLRILSEYSDLIEN